LIGTYNPKTGAKTLRAENPDKFNFDDMLHITTNLWILLNISGMIGLGYLIVKKLKNIKLLKSN
jgi:hypothetical protein